MTDRLCLCGCGASLEGKRSHAKYANGACRARASTTKAQAAVSGEPDGLFLLASALAALLGLALGSIAT